MQHWSNSTSLDLVSHRPAGRPFLVFVVPSGRMESPLLRTLEGTRNFDLAVRFYESPGMNEDLAKGAEFVMTGGLSKFHSAAHFIQACRLDGLYQGYLFLDGDIEFDAAQLGSFFSIVHAAGLDLAQPSLTRDSYCYWKMAYHQPGYVFRETSFVEVMAPYISRAALPRVLDTFTRSISGYGLDLVWPKLIGSGAIGVVDAFQVRHREVVDHAAGSFYRYLKSINVDLDEEERLMLARYGVELETAHSRRGYFWSGSRGTEQTPRLKSVPLFAMEKKVNRQSLIDVGMHLARWLPARDEPHLGAAVSPFLSADGLSCRSSRNG